MRLRWLLTVLAIASIVGTVLKQAEPYTTTSRSSGSSGSRCRDDRPYDVYHAAWFLVILLSW